MKINFSVKVFTITLSLLFVSETIAQSVISGNGIFRTLENTRFINSYKQMNQTANTGACIQLCSSETNCKAVSFLWLSRNPTLFWHPTFFWYPRSAGNICYFYNTSSPSTSTDGKQFFTSFVRESFRTLENTRFINSYKQMNQIANTNECMRLCSSETYCKAVSFLWLSRNPTFSWYPRSAGNICFFYGTSNPATSNDGKQFFTSYVRL
jgi:hypothetical protein